MFEIQVERCVRESEINTQCVVMRGCQVELPNHNRTQKRCVNPVDVNGEAFLLCSPPNPPANAVRDGKWRKPNRQQCRDQEKKTNKNESTFQGHLDRCSNDGALGVAGAYGAPCKWRMATPRAGFALWNRVSELAMKRIWNHMRILVTEAIDAHSSSLFIHPVRFGTPIKD